METSLGHPVHGTNVGRFPDGVTELSNVEVAPPSQGSGGRRCGHRSKAKGHVSVTEEGCLPKLGLVASWRRR